MLQSTLPFPPLSLGSACASYPHPNATHSWFLLCMLQEPCITPKPPPMSHRVPLPGFDTKTHSWNPRTPMRSTSLPLTSRGCKDLSKGSCTHLWCRLGWGHTIWQQVLLYRRSARFCHHWVMPDSYRNPCWSLQGQLLHSTSKAGRIWPSEFGYFKVGDLNRFGIETPDPNMPQLWVVRSGSVQTFLNLREEKVSSPQPRYNNFALRNQI